MSDRLSVIDGDVAYLRRRLPQVDDATHREWLELARRAGRTEVGVLILANTASGTPERARQVLSEFLGHLSDRFFPAGRPACSTAGPSSG